MNSDDYPDDRHGGSAEPPHAEDAERSLIGSVMLDASHYQKAVDREQIMPLTPMDFYNGHHKWLWGGILAMWKEDRHADPVTLAHFLRNWAGDDDKDKKNGLIAAGGPEYIASLADLGAAPVNVPAYAKIIKDTSQQRQLIEALSRAHTAAWQAGGKTPAEMVLAAAAEIQKVEDDIHGVMPTETPGKLARLHLDKLGDAIHNMDFSALDGEPTGLTPFDELISGGFRAGKLTILGAQTGQGKTALALDIANRLVRRKRPVLFVSLEMDEQELVERLLARAARVDLLKIMRGREGFGGEYRGKPLDHLELTRLAEAAAEINGLPLFIRDKNIDNLDAIMVAVRSGIRRANLLYGTNPGLIVVDYLQLVRPTESWGRRDTRAVEVGDVSRALKNLARETSLPVLALAQLNRNLEKRENKEPLLSDLRDSGAIEQDADLVAFLFSEQPPAEQSPYQKVVPRVIAIAKNRSGVSGGRVVVDFHRGHMLFGAASTL